MAAGIQISGDDLAILANTDRWHDAMHRMGRVAVETALRRVPGRPTDVIDDVGGDPPYPTREFCERWCIEQDNVVFRFSLRTAVVLTLFGAAIVCLIQAYGDFSGAPVRSIPSMGGRSATVDSALPRVTGGPSTFYNGPAFQPTLPPRSYQQ
jgi:hypothetical protein